MFIAYMVPKLYKYSFWSFYGVIEWNQLGINLLNKSCIKLEFYTEGSVAQW